MTIDATQVRVASDGRIRIAPVGTAAPADATTAPAVAWTDLGYATDDGVTITPGMATDDIAAWQSSVPVRRIVTGSSLEIGFTLIQSNAETLSIYFNATADGDVLTIPTSPVPYETALLVDWLDAGVAHRLYVARAQLSDRGDLTLSRGSAVGLDMTFSALPNGSSPDLATVILPPVAP